MGSTFSLKIHFFGVQILSYELEDIFTKWYAMHKRLTEKKVEFIWLPLKIMLSHGIEHK